MDQQQQQWYEHKHLEQPEQQAERQQRPKQH
jgi:hypothetical protein